MAGTDREPAPAGSFATHRQASGWAGLPVSNQTQDKDVLRRAGKKRMISVITSSFRHTCATRVSAQVRERCAVAPEAQSAGFVVSEGG
jgi:hypothetical protein